MSAIVFAYRVATVPAIGTSPYFLTYLRQPRLPTDVLYGEVPKEPLDPNDYVKQKTRLMRNAFASANESQDRDLASRKTYYDRKQQNVTFLPGDLVWLHTPRTKKGETRKLGHRNSGPYEVLERVTDVNYVVRVGPKPADNLRVHVQRLIPYHESPYFPVTRTSLPEARVANVEQARRARGSRKARARSKKSKKPQSVEVEVEVDDFEPAIVPEQSENVAQDSGNRILSEYVDPEQGSMCRVLMGGFVVAIPKAQVPKDLVRDFQHSERAKRRQRQ